MRKAKQQKPRRIPKGIYYINVTQEDIDKGKPYNVRSCPIGLAARRRFPDAKLIEVTNTLVVDDSTSCKSNDIGQFVEVFDELNGKGRRFLKPFTLKLTFL